MQPDAPFGGTGLTANNLAGGLTGPPASLRRWCQLTIAEIDSKRQTSVDLTDDTLVIQRLEVQGAPAEAAREAQTRGHDLELVVRQMLDLGGTLIRHGSSQATVDSVAAEVNRLVDSVVRATAEQLPAAFEEHIGSLRDVLDTRFDGKRSGSVQQQLAKSVREISTEHQRDLSKALLDESGPLGMLKAELDARIRLLLSRHDEVIKQLTSVNERLLASHVIDQERDRGTAKGADFETWLGDVLVWVAAPHEDLISEVGKVTGVDGSKCGDYEIAVNPSGTRGRDIRIVVEAKCRRLSLKASLSELDRAMSNRDAHAGILVFSHEDLAPLVGGRSRSSQGTE